MAEFVAKPAAMVRHAKSHSYSVEAKVLSQTMVRAISMGKDGGSMGNDKHEHAFEIHDRRASDGVATLTIEQVGGALVPQLTIIAGVDANGTQGAPCARFGTDGEHFVGSVSLTGEVLSLKLEPGIAIRERVNEAGEREFVFLRQDQPGQTTKTRPTLRLVNRETGQS